jgi:HEAT repeat protein
VRRTSALALGRIGDPKAVPALTQQALTNEDSGSRSTATAALGDIGDAAAVEPLLQLLEDGNDTVRAMAAQSLGKIGDARATGALLGRLTDRTYGVRGRAIEALAGIGDPAAVEPLARYYWQTEGDRRRMAKSAWDDALRAWSERGDVKLLRLFIAADTSGEPIVKSIEKALSSVGGASKSGSAAQAGAPREPGEKRPWWKFWGR